MTHLRPQKLAIGVVLCTALSVPAVAWARVTSCVLRNPIILNAGPENQGRRVHINSGATVEVMRRSGGWVQLRAGDDEGYVRAANLRRSCRMGGTKGEALAGLALEPLPAAGENLVAQTPALAPVAQQPSWGLAAATPALPAAPIAPSPVDADVADSAENSASMTWPHMPPHADNHRSLPIVLWTAAAVGVAAGAGLGAYELSHVAALRSDIQTYNAQATHDAGTAQGLHQRENQAKLWMIVAGASAGLGATAAVFAIVLGASGSDTSAMSENASAAPMTLGLTPGGLVFSGLF